MVKRVKGYGNNYWVTSSGRVITTNWRNTGKTKFLRPALDKKGYLRVSLMKGGRLITHKVHRLVAEAFVVNPFNKPQVNHKNGDKKDNYYSNLEWVTGSENMKHAVMLGLVKMCSPINKIPKCGELNGGAKLTDSQVLKIRSSFKPRHVTRKILASEYGVTESCIKDIIIRKSWKHI